MVGKRTNGGDNVFDETDFKVFEDPTLAGRMAGIKSQIDPKFEALAPLIIAQLQGEQPVYAHVAKHLRRFKNPPMNTWIAFSANPRGYKMMPHLMIGFWDDRLFCWVGSLAEAKLRAQLTTCWTTLLPELTKLPVNYELSPNHMAKKSTIVSDLTLTQQLTHYQQVKQADFLVGRQWYRNDSIFKTPAKVQTVLIETVNELKPIYRALNQVK